MKVLSLEVRGFRNLRDAHIELGAGITVLHGPNGAGKTNVLEALAFALTGRSPRTSTDREMIAFGAEVARAEARVGSPGGERRMAAALARQGEKRLQVDGTATPRRADLSQRPALSIFIPDRLALVKGPPAGRRSHLDAFCSALWPARADRRRYRETLAQRNALLGRIRAGEAGGEALVAWDAELAAAGLALTRLRAEAVERLAGPLAEVGDELGLTGTGIAYHPALGGRDEEGFLAELTARRKADVARAHTGFGPHRDEVLLQVSERAVRRYGSQGEQRLALLALLLAEREVLAEALPAPPVMLLDDVMSELDAERRGLLVDRLSGGGQAVLTATEPAHVPASSGVVWLEVRAGRVPAGGDGS